MKLTHILKRQHIDFMFKKHWLIQGKRIPIETGVEQHLKEKGIQVEDALEFVKDKPIEHERLKIVGFYDPPLPLDENHPEYKDRPCYTLTPSNVLLEGISQAQVLTKTIIADNILPPKIEELAKRPVDKAIHEGVKKAILSANVFDCEQEKLPKMKDPERPAFNFPRILGITDKRRNIILTNKLVQLVEKTADPKVTLSKFAVSDVDSTAVFQKEEDLIQFQERSNILITDRKPLKYEPAGGDIPFIEIPDLYPVKYNITLTPEHFYSEESKYPVRAAASARHPHTTWLHFNESLVANLYEAPVTRAQRLGRAVTHAFGVAAAYAKQTYGEDVTDLPEPVYLNCIQTDGRLFHFGVLQLNTLQVSGAGGASNVWYCKNDVELYAASRYFGGMPSLENYNPKVYGYIRAFYNC